MLSTTLGLRGHRVIAPFWHSRSLFFPKGCYHHDLKAFYESGDNNLFKNIIENIK